MDITAYLLRERDTRYETRATLNYIYIIAHKPEMVNGKLLRV